MPPAGRSAARAVAAPRVVSIDDLRTLARRRLPRVVFDYIDGGAEDEVTLRANRRAFEEITFRPRHAAPTAAPDLRTTVLGAPLDAPLLLAPVGSSRLFWPNGEVAVARAAGSARTPYVLSTMAGCRLEDVSAAATAPLWYQLYLAGGHDAARAAIARARAAAYQALVVTIDTPVAGMRERDVRNGSTELLTRRLRAMLPYLPQILSRPRWLAAFLGDGGLMTFPNVEIPGEGPMRYANVAEALGKAMVNWDDFGWIRDAWHGPIVVKGVLTAEDAHRAMAEGAQAIVVSNHGGRQLDGVPATLRALPEVVAAVNGRIDVLLDGGIRRGADIVKALCLGAGAVLIGRAYAYGLGAAGEAGVARAIDILRADLVRTLILLGCPSVAALDDSYVNLPGDWRRAPDAQPTW